jgi:RNA-binding protein
MITPKQKKTLKQLAHKRKPLVQIGASGLTDNVLAALDEALLKHELVKVKIAAADRDERDRIIQALVEHSKADMVQRVGNIATLFRRNPQNVVIRFK